MNNINPFSFTSTTENNHDCLSQLQVLRAHDQAKFIKLQQLKIDGLQNADVFEYHYMSELANLPAGTCLLNTIWIAASANWKLTFPNTEAVSVLMVQNNRQH